MRPTQQAIADMKHPCGTHVTMTYRRNTLLGEVVDFDTMNDGTLRLYVRHFNGDFWPINPLFWELTFLER